MTQEPRFPNTFAGTSLDRAGPARHDAAWIAARLADPESLALAATGSGVFLRGAGEGGGAEDVPAPGPEAAERYDTRAWLAEPGGPLRPALVPLTRLTALDGAAPPVLLGLRDEGEALFAVDLEGVDEQAAAAAVAPGALAGVRDAAAQLSAPDAGLVGYATAMLNWHRRNGHCANCGARSEPGEAGHVRTCPACGASHHPRTDPVVIMLVVDEARDRVLLGRQPAWPPGRYSALAGFVEPGESLESAVAREVLEESAVTVADARYASSQPWPFPASLMLGFVARYVAGEPVAADGELEDARWFSRAEVADAVAGRSPGLRVPPPVAIARRLIDGWLEAGPPEAATP